MFNKENVTVFKSSRIGIRETNEDKEIYIQNLDLNSPTTRYDPNYAPIDLFIEDFLFANYPELHPYQFLSLHQLVNEGKKAVTDKRAEKLTP